jgi:hypothetical protein
VRETGFAPAQAAFDTAHATAQLRGARQFAESCAIRKISEELRIMRRWLSLTPIQPAFATWTVPVRNLGGVAFISSGQRHWALRDDGGPLVRL